MSNKTKKINLVFVPLLFLLIFSPSAYLSKADSLWEISRNTYEYTSVYDVKRYDYEGNGNLEYSNTTTEEIMIWDVESNGNNLTFRTTKYITFLSMIDCDSPECYEEFLEVLEYDNETESIKATYFYNETEQKIGFVDPTTMEFLGFEIDVPIDTVELPMSFLMWDYIGCLFLPIASLNFSFESNYTIYSEIYEDFELTIENTFRLDGKTFEGFSLSYEYTFYILIEGLPGKKYCEEAEIQYNSLGELYHYYGKTEEYREVDDKYEIYRIGELDFSIDSVDENLAIAKFEWLFGVVALAIIMILSRKRGSYFKR